jgi:hypothetical protein
MECARHLGTSYACHDYDFAVHLGCRSCQSPVTDHPDLIAEKTGTVFLGSVVDGSKR